MAPLTLHVEYAKRRKAYGILFIISPFHEFSNLEYVHVPIEHRVHQAEYVIHIRVAASQECVNTDSKCRRLTLDRFTHLFQLRSWLQDTSKRRLADFFYFFRAPHLPVSPGSPEADPMIDQNRRSENKESG